MSPIARKTAEKPPATTPRKRAARKPVGPPAPPSVDPFEAPVTADDTERMEPPAAVPDVITTEENEVSEEVVESAEKRTRTPDPLLAAKRRLEKARATEAKAQARVDKHGDILKALEDAKNETAAAAEAFAVAVAAV